MRLQYYLFAVGAILLSEPLQAKESYDFPETAQKGLAMWRCAVLSDVGGQAEDTTRSQFQSGHVLLSSAMDVYLNGRYMPEELSSIPYIILGLDGLSSEVEFQLGMLWRDVERAVHSEIDVELLPISQDARSTSRPLTAMSLFDKGNCKFMVEGQ